MLNKKIIFITGNKRSGKDYTARYLQKRLSNSEILSFAEPLKEIIATTLGISLKELDKFKNNKEMLYLKEPQFSEGGVTTNYNELIDFRTLLQRFGTEAMKPIFGDDVWVDVLVSRMLGSKADTFIIPDWRFKIEYESLLPDYTIRVLGGEKGDSHSSETELQDFTVDIVVDNTKKDRSEFGELDKLINDIENELTVDMPTQKEDTNE